MILLENPIQSHHFTSPIGEPKNGHDEMEVGACHPPHVRGNFRRRSHRSSINIGAVATFLGSVEAGKSVEKRPEVFEGGNCRSAGRRERLAFHVKASRDRTGASADSALTARATLYNAVKGNGEHRPRSYPHVNFSPNFSASIALVRFPLILHDILHFISFACLSMGQCKIR